MLNGNLIINIIRRGLRELVAPKMCFSCTDISDVGGFMARLLCVGFVWMIRCGRPAAFMRLYEAQTIGDNVLCHATVVVSAINLLKSRGISTWWYPVGETVRCIHVWSSHVAELD